MLLRFSMNVMCAFFFSLLTYTIVTLLLLMKEKKKEEKTIPVANVCDICS